MHSQDQDRHAYYPHSPPHPQLQIKLITHFEKAVTGGLQRRGKVWFMINKCAYGNAESGRFRFSVELEHIFGLAIDYILDYIV